MKTWKIQTNVKSDLDDLELDAKAITSAILTAITRRKKAKAAGIAVDQAHIIDTTENEITTAFRKAADEAWGRDGECEIDNNAIVSISDDGGAYVAAWVWVTDAAANVCTECRENLTDDGEGYDGTCGSCADKAEPVQIDGETFTQGDANVLKEANLIVSCEHGDQMEDCADWYHLLEGVTMAQLREALKAHAD